MTNVNVNSYPTYYRQSVTNSTLQCGLMGAFIGGVSKTVSNRKALKNFSALKDNADEFAKIDRNDKKLIIQRVKNVRDNFCKLVGKEAGRLACVGAIAGLVTALIGNAICAKKEAM